MLADVILGIAAGAGAQYVEPRVKDALEKVLLAEAPMSAIELRMFTLAICLVGAAILSVIFGDNGAFALAVGALIGIFGPRLIDQWQRRKAPDYGDDV